MTKFNIFYLSSFQVVTDLCKTHLEYLSADNIVILREIFSFISSHAHQLKSERILQKKLPILCSILELSEPPLVHFENESFQNYLDFLKKLLADNPSLSEEMNIEAELVAVCQQILQIYLHCTGSQSAQVNSSDRPMLHCIISLGSAKKEELVARTSLVVSALWGLSGLERDSFKRYVSQFFPLLVDLVQSEHSSGEVQRVLSNMFHSCIGPIIIME